MNQPIKLADFKPASKIRTKYLSPKYRYLSTAADSDFSALKDKYSKFANHSDIYTAAVGAFMSAGRAFTGQELGTPYGDKPFFTNPPIVLLKDIARPSNETGRFMALEKNWVETRLKANDLDLTLSYRNPDKLATSEGIIKQYFPTFTLPRAFKGADLEGKHNLGRFSVGERLTVLISVEAFSMMVPNYTPPGGPVDDKEKDKFRFKLPKGYKDSGYNKIAYVELTLEQDRALLEDEYAMRVLANQEGSLLGGSFKVRIPVKASLVFRWPWEFALYVTCAETREKFVPFLFFQYVNWHRIAYAGKRTRGGGLSIKPPARVNHLGNIADMIEVEKKAGRIVTPRINEDGFAIMGTGEPAMLGKVVWIDKGANRISEYMEQIRSSYDPQNKVIDLSKLKIKGTALFYDAHNEKFVYIREAGSDTHSSSDVSGMQTLDLTGSIALDDVTIAKHLNMRLRKDAQRFTKLMEVLYKIEGGAWPDVKLSQDYTSREVLAKFGFDAYDSTKGRDILSECAQTVLDSPDLDLTWATLCGRKLTLTSPDGDITEDSEAGQRLMRMRKLRAFSQLLVAFCSDLLRNFDKLEFAYSEKVEQFRFVLMLVTKYGFFDKKYQDTLNAAIERNTRKNFTKEEVLNITGKLNVPNLPGVETLMPHQSESLQDLAIKPPMSFLEVVVGGGKTVIGLIHALNLIQKGDIKRALFPVPGHLVKNWANEIQKFSKGQVNVIILTIHTVRRLQQVYLGESGNNTKPRYVFLKKLIEACPPNTIFITNFKFLLIDKEEIVYGNSVIKRYYSAEFLREMQFDCVIIDESHGVKTLGAAQTQGAAIVTSVSKYKTLMSGTLINNTLIDLVGQSAIGNPAALGNQRDFIANYGASFSGEDGEDTVGEWRPDAASLIIQDMRPYVKRMIHKRNRIAFMLPESIEHFHPVQMTPLQKSFYDALVTTKFEALREQNPKLYAKMMDANEKDDGAITVGLATHFQAVEEFLCAPDSVEEFLDLDTITEQDKVSPKVAKIVELLDQHFNGFTADGVQHPADEYKVIIFGNRKASSAHVFKHMPENYRKMAVHYTADNKQAAELFERNDKIRILVADGASITSGLNLQFAARMIRLETVWSPGDLEQAFARIWRPAFGGRGSERQKVYLDWLVCNYSLDVAKIGRIISKHVEKMKYDRQEDPNFVYKQFIPSPNFSALELYPGHTMADELPQIKIKQPIAQMLNTLPLIKMNKETLEELQETSQLAEYFATYALCNDFEIQEFEREKREGIQEVVRIPDEVRSTIEGSKTLAYKPRVPGMNPDVFDPSKYFGYKPISIIDNEIVLNALEAEGEGEDEDEKGVEVNPVQPGELVSTEFGVGLVSKILQHEVWVEIKGLGKVRVPKATAWIISNPIAKQGILNTLKRGTIVYNPPGISTSNNDVYELGTTRPVNTGTQIQPDVEDAEIVAPQKIKVKIKTKEPVAPEQPTMPAKDEKLKPQVVVKPKYDVYDDEDEDVANSINILGEIIDGQIALTCNAGDQDSDMLITDYDFQSIDKYVAVKVITPDALDGVLNLLKEKFTIREELIENFEVYRGLLKSKRLLVSKPADFRQTIQFFKQQTKMLKKGFIRPYPIVWGDNLYVAMDFNKTPSIREVTQAIRSAAIHGAVIQKPSDGVHVKFYRSAEEAIEELGQIADNVSVPTADDTVKWLEGIKKQASKVTVKSVPAKTTVPATNSPKIRVKVKPKAVPEPVPEKKKIMVRIKK